MSIILTAADAFVLATANDELKKKANSKVALRLMLKVAAQHKSEAAEASSSEDRSDRCSLRSTAKDTVEKDADKCL